MTAPALAEPRAFASPLYDEDAEPEVIGVPLNQPSEVLPRISFLEPADFRHKFFECVLIHARHIFERGELPTSKALYHRLRSDDLQLGLSPEQIGQDLDRLSYAYSASLPEDAERAARSVANLGRRGASSSRLEKRSTGPSSSRIRPPGDASFSAHPAPKFGQFSGVRRQVPALDFDGPETVLSARALVSGSEALAER